MKKRKILSSALAVLLLLSTFTAAGIMATAKSNSKSQIGYSSTYWEYADGVLTISGEGDMPDFSWTSQPWYDIQDQIQSVVISKGVTAVGSCAFESCSSLKSVTLPEGLTTIGTRAFFSCTSLKSVTFSEGLTTIKILAFSECSSLKTVILPKSLSSLDKEAFENLDFVSVAEGNITYHSAGNCVIETATKTLVLGTNNSVIPADGSVTAVGKYAFCECASLESVTLPEGITEIGYSAFHGCAFLTSVLIPEGVTSIEEYAFGDCTSLTSITIPKELITIKRGLFSGCSSLKSIRVPDEVVSIEELAFEHCTSLESVTLSKELISIDYKIFDGCTSLTSVICPAKVPPSTDSNTFYNTPENLKFYVPEECLDTYKRSWRQFKKGFAVLDESMLSEEVAEESETEKDSGGSSSALPWILFGVAVAVCVVFVILLRKKKSMTK